MAKLAKELEKSNIHELLSSLTYTDLREIWENHFEWSLANRRVAGNPKWFCEPGMLNVIGIRCNSEAEFNFGKYNDYLILLYNKPDEKYDYVLLEATIDPCKNRSGIAHLRQGIWNSYEVGVHGLSTGRDEEVFPKIGRQKRWCLRQSKNQVEVLRTDGKGKVINSERGMFYINIHDNGGFNDSSLGCTVIRNQIDYVTRFLPYIYDIKTHKIIPLNQHDITYCLINHLQLENYTKQRILRQEQTR